MRPFNYRDFLLPKRSKGEEWEVAKDVYEKQIRNFDLDREKVIEMYATEEHHRYPRYFSQQRSVYDFAVMDKDNVLLINPPCIYNWPRPAARCNPRIDPKLLQPLLLDLASFLHLLRL